MKRFFLSAMTISLVMLAGCNNESSTSTESASKDSSATESSSTSSAMPAANNVVTKDGLPMGANQEVPVNSSTATGTIDAKYNKDTKTLSYKVTWTGLTDKPTMAHIHGTAPKGVNAGVAHDLTNVIPKETAGSFTDSVKIEGSKIKEDSLLSGFYYINIHTPKNKGGEIRGQLEF